MGGIGGTGDALPRIRAHRVMMESRDRIPGAGSLVPSNPPVHPEKPQPSPPQADPRPGPAAPPDVIVDFLLDRSMLLVSVHNIGSGCAHAVRVDVQPTFRGGGGAVDMAAIALFHRLDFLAPGREIRAFVDVADAYFARGEPEVIACSVTFRDDAGRSHSRRIRHDLGVYRELPRRTDRSADW
jgi:hypothetical protein